VGCPVPVNITDNNVEGLAYHFVPGPNITGTIKMPKERRLQIPPVVKLRSGLPGHEITLAAKENGTVEGIGLKPAEYRIDYNPPDGFYVKSIEFNHHALPDHILDLTPCTGGTIEIAVSPNAAKVSVTVLGAKRAKVSLWTNSSVRTKESSDGTVVFRNLAPEEYRVLAWETVDERFVGIPEFRDRFDAYKVTLKEGSHQNIQVKLISKSASDEEVLKLR